MCFSSTFSFSVLNVCVCFIRQEVTIKKRNLLMCDSVEKRLELVERSDELWGEEPPYTPGAEDKANLFQQLYYGWIGDFIFKAAKDSITADDLPPPTRENRAYNIGRDLSRRIHEDLTNSKCWDSYIGCEVRYKNEMETFGHLRFVGHLRQSDHPRRMLAGVEWQVAPRFRRNASEESGAALHNGTVHGEFLFTTADDKRCGSLEPVEDGGASLWGPEGTATTKVTEYDKGTFHFAMETSRLSIAGKAARRFVWTVGTRA
ncbi:hypothetical protein AGDE_06189, partial [Angomonas deanei]